MPEVDELFPWDLEEWMNEGKDFLLLDVREPYEFEPMHIENSINVPRGILESAVEYRYEETVPELVKARDRNVVIICRSGNRSLLAAKTMKMMGYQNPYSLKTGLRGWNDYELPMIDINGNAVDMEVADDYFDVKITDEQLGSDKR